MEKKSEITGPDASPNSGPVRCPWARHDEELAYHDAEWGLPDPPPAKGEPCASDLRQYEFLVLEAAQSGLSWLTILRKRAGYRDCFAGFDPALVARFTERDIAALLQDQRIVRNRAKIESAIGNAAVFLDIQEKYGSFSYFLWNFTDGRVIRNHWKKMEEAPAKTALSERIAKEMKKLGFRFLGPVVIYSHLQATGLVNDHVVDCFRHQELCDLADKLGL